MLVEREREREREGGPGAAWSIVAAWCQHGSGPATVENGGVGATVENGGVSATRIDVADRWTGTLRGPDHQRLGEVVGAALTGGVSSTVRPIQFSNRIKFISNGFKFAPNFD
jgi:hypothetical protein